MREEIDLSDDQYVKQKIEDINEEINEHEKIVDRLRELKTSLLENAKGVEV